MARNVAVGVLFGIAAAPILTAAYWWLFDPSSLFHFDR